MPMAALGIAAAANEGLLREQLVIRLGKKVSLAFGSQGRVGAARYENHCHLLM